MRSVKKIGVLFGAVGALLLANETWAYVPTSSHEATNSTTDFGPQSRAYGSYNPSAENPYRNFSSPNYRQPYSSGRKQMTFDVIQMFTSGRYMDFLKLYMQNRFFGPMESGIAEGYGSVLMGGVSLNELRKAWGDPEKRKDLWGKSTLISGGRMIPFLNCPTAQQMYGQNTNPYNLSPIFNSRRRPY